MDGRAEPGSYLPAGSTNPRFTLPCPAGYRCPGGSSDRIPCTAPGTFCPDGAAKADYCPGMPPPAHTRSYAQGGGP
jgi:hypothetical protein